MRIHSLGALPFLYLSGTYAHGDHTGDHSSDNTAAQSGNAADYAQRHMAQEHHIDTFDISSFFQLHDLNRDGYWAKDEIEAVYGVHHVYAKKMSKDEWDHARKAKAIVETVLRNMDKDGDEQISSTEFEAAGLTALPNFEELGAHGHHYDVESEFFLHHEEEYHSTPETQSDESYTHPEDIEHFAHHDDIELVEAEREAKFQGISVEEALAQHDPEKQPPRKTRKSPEEDVDPAIRFREAKAESEKLGSWGEGEGGFRPPSTPNQKMRKNLPYKYKFRKAWGDF